VTIALFSESYLQKNRDAKIVFDVCCSSFISEFVKSKGCGDCKPSRPLVHRKQNETGERRVRRRVQQSLVFSEIFGLDDAIFAGLKLLEILSSKGKPLADLIDSVPKYPATNVESINCPDEIKFQVVESLKPKIESLGYKILALDGIKAFGRRGLASNSRL